MRVGRSLSALFTGIVALTTATQSFAYDVLIVSNNDLNSTNPNRGSALLLAGALTCAEAQHACDLLQESLLPPPNNTGFSAGELVQALTSDKHGAALDRSQNIWVAGNSTCDVFSLDSQQRLVAQPKPSQENDDRLSALCTNSAPLARSNVTSYDTSRQIQVSTSNAGILQGFRDKFSWRFLGIKFAEPTTGDARFQVPTALKVAPNTTRSALEYGPYCAQAPDADNGHVVHTSEDCLQLNIYTPLVSFNGNADSEHKLPVMVFIHGGALNTGDSGPFSYNMTSNGFVGNSISNVYDGTNLVSYGGVVLVTINYRLTAFGWFNASNAALKDSLLALQWVQDNIGVFGGDSTKVTIFGESAGAIMVRFLLGTNPKYTSGLFSGAILESDLPIGSVFESSVLALNTSLTLATSLGCASNTSMALSASDVACVQNKSAADIALASLDLSITWMVTVDGDYVLTDFPSSVKEGQWARVPTVWASNECEGCYFLPFAANSSVAMFSQQLGAFFNQTVVQAITNDTALFPYSTAPPEDGISGSVLTVGRILTDFDLHCPMAYLASLEANVTDPIPSYKAVFATGLSSPLTPNTELCPGQVCHADELYWVFGTAETDGLYQPFSDVQLSTARDVMSRWTNFARTGNPNYVGASIQWAPYTGDNELVINATNTVQPYHVGQCDFFTNEVGFSFEKGL